MSALPLYNPSRAPSLLDELLSEQQSLSAVDVFARHHEAGAASVNARVYEERIPVGRLPRPGQQLAFRVDLDACTGCKACVTACHSLNGLAPEETWRDVGLLLGESGTNEPGCQQTVTTACHHCEDPACLAGCPVQAYEKDPVTGIVRHLDDQCIGCQYCVLKCPYDVPKYNVQLGIVRKCDMCTGRLSAGEAPACVQGCPNGAISIEIVDSLGSGPTPELLPGVSDAIPDSAYTRPTTRYVSERPVASLQPANADRLVPAQAHDPLAVMLVLMQLSVGTLLFDVLAPTMGVASGFARPFGLGLAASSALLGLGAATLHLGRPLYAFRAFLGWRTSWMSREIVVFGAYAPAVVLAATASVWVHLEGSTSVGPAWMVDVAGVLLPALRASALVLGLAGSVCSAMIYVDTHRPAWALSRTGPAFAGTLLGLGALGAAAAAALGIWILDGVGGSGAAGLLLVGTLALSAKVGTEARLLARRSDASAALDKTSRLLRGPLRARMRLRFELALVGILTGVAALALALVGAHGWVAALAVGALSFHALGEFLERHLYFTAEASPGMPGH